MKDFNSMNAEKMILQKVWELFDVLRRDITREDNYIILLFIYLKSENLIPQQNYEHKAKDILIQLLKNGHDITIQQIYDAFLPSINKISDKSINYVIDVLNSIDLDMLQQNIEKIFEETLQSIAFSKSIRGDEFVQPKQITQFINAYIGSTKGLKIFNPFAGVASFIQDYQDANLVYAQEVDKKIWAIGKLRLMIHQSSAIFNCEDSVLDYPSEKQFDLIVANPPFSMQRNDIYQIEEFLLEKSFNFLAKTGKLITILPYQFLFSDNSFGKKLKKNLIQQDLIDTIIAFPSRMLHHTIQPFIVLILNKSKNIHNKIKLIDANPFVTQISRESSIQIDELLQITQLTEDNEYVRIISNEKVEENNCNLNIAKYFQEEVEGVKLDKIISYVRGIGKNFPKKGKVIRNSDLKDDIDTMDFYLNTKDIQEIPLDKPMFCKIDYSCLLLSLRSKTLKPTYFHFVNEPIYYNDREMCSFKVEKSIVDIDYLIHELYADYVTKQLKGILYGDNIFSRIRVHDLLDLKIKLPSLEEQQAKITALKTISQKIKQLKHEQNELAQGITSKLYESASSIKHSLGTPLLNIGSSLRNIEVALSKVDANWQHIKLHQEHDISIKDSFNSIYSNLELIHTILQNNQSVLDCSNYELTSIDFLSFIQNYVRKLQVAQKNTNVSILLDIHPDIKKKNVNNLLANSKLLEIALNTILDNANRHAFTDVTEKYKLEFRISWYTTEKNIQDSIEEKTYIKIEVLNNGNPFPKNYFLDKLIRKNSFAGETGNTGQGGFDLNEIVKYHNKGVSTLELITDNQTNDYITIYSFLIPYEI